MDDKDTIIRHLTDNSAVKASKNKKYIQHLNREFKEELKKLQNEGNNWKKKCHEVEYKYFTLEQDNCTIETDLKRLEKDFCQHR